MGLNVEAGTGFEPKQKDISKKGPRVAIISGIIDIGMQPHDWKGEQKADRREFIPILTLCSDKYTDEEGVERCMVTSPWPVAISLGDKSNYTKFCKAADPNGEVLPEGIGDVTDLIGRTVFAVMVHTKPTPEGIVYSNCKGIQELPEDYPVPETEYNRVVFDTTEPDKEVFDKLWERTQKLITTGTGFKGFPDVRVEDPKDGDTSPF